MPSGLRAKLNAMKTASPPVRPARPEGLICHVTRTPVDARLFELSGTGLRRIGWNGPRFDVTRCLFLDTETTGLSHGVGTVAFLVGVGHVEGGELVIEQYLMRDYGAEPEMIERLGARLGDCDCVCTFNGKTFDMPLLKTRFTMCRMQQRWRDLDNLDLVIPARRAWKLRLGSCKLSAIEAQILGMPRHDDLPGSEVPARYFEYLKTGDEALLKDIVDHNRQDIATLADLLIRLCEINACPEALTDQRDLFSMGRALERQGELRPARELYRLSAIPRPAGTLAALSGTRIAGMANWRLYLLARKNGDVQGMLGVLEQMLSRRQLQGQVCIELAKLYEHRLGDAERALEYALKARDYPDCGAAEALDRRIARLKAKSEK